MKVSDKGLAEIAGHEGIVLKRYLDSVGVWTIGIGHTASAGDPVPKNVKRALSPAEAMEIFRRDIARFEHRVNDAVKVPLLQHEFDALVSFDFNTGGIYRALLTKSLNAGAKGEAARRFMGWLKPPEIEPRRRAEMHLFRTGRYGDGHATVFDASSAGKIDWQSGKRVNVLAQISAGQPVPDPKPKSVDPQLPVPTTDPAAKSKWQTILAAFLKLFRIGQ